MKIEHGFLRLFIYSLLLLGVVLSLTSCGGGGGGGSRAMIIGRVLEVGTKEPPSPQATVSAGGSNTQTSAVEGDFQLSALVTATALQVQRSGFPAFEYALPRPLVGGQTYDLGYLYVGPQMVTVRGRVVDALDNSPLPGAKVSLWGRETTTSAQGTFSLTNVAYDDAGISQVSGLPDGVVEIEGTIGGRTYIPTEFFPENPPDVNNVVEMGDIPIAPVSSQNPPPTPGNVIGRVRVAATVPVVGTRIDIYRVAAGETFLRSMILTASNQIDAQTANFALWLVSGSYNLKFFPVGATTPRATRPVTVTNINQTIDLGQISLE